MPLPPLSAISAEDEVRPAAPMSWMAMMASVAISSRQASSSSFSVKGSPTCTVGRFSFDVLVEFRRGHGGAVNAVAAGLGADIDDGIARALGGGQENLVGARQADAHGVDQDVAVVAAVEIDFTAHRGHAHAVAITADAGDHARHQMPGLGMRRLAEAQRIHHGDGARAHGEDIAHDATHARRRALIGLDEAGMVVRFHLEDAGIAIADVDHAGILARALMTQGALVGSFRR